MDWGSIDARFDTTYIDDQEFSSSLYGNAESYTLMNARLGVAGIELEDAGTLRAALWGKNLGDKEYKVYGADFAVDQGFGYAGNSFGPPRSYGIDVIYDYESQ